MKKESDEFSGYKIEEIGNQLVAIFFRRAQKDGIYGGLETEVTLGEDWLAARIKMMGEAADFSKPALAELLARKALGSDMNFLS